jgi:hypothetical protein
MRNARCSIERSTLHIEHYGYCRFMRKSKGSDDVGWLVHIQGELDGTGVGQKCTVTRTVSE